MYCFPGCCSTSDWRRGRESEGTKVPDSCCKTESPGCGTRDHPSNIPYTGCRHRFSDQLTQHLLLLGLVSLGLAMLQVIGVILTSCLFAR
jgi:CD151 antigen